MHKLLLGKDPTLLTVSRYVETTGRRVSLCRCNHCSAIVIWNVHGRCSCSKGTLVRCICVGGLLWSIISGCQMTPGRELLAADCCVCRCVCCVRCHVTGCLVVDARVDGTLGLNILVWGLCHCLGVKEGSVTTFPPRTTNLTQGVISASITSLAGFPLLFSCLSIGSRSFLLSFISAGNCSFIPTFEPLSLKVFLSTFILSLNLENFTTMGRVLSCVKRPILCALSKRTSSLIRRVFEISSLTCFSASSCIPSSGIFEKIKLSLIDLDSAMITLFSSSFFFNRSWSRSSRHLSIALFCSFISFLKSSYSDDRYLMAFSSSSNFFSMPSSLSSFVTICAICRWISDIFLSTRWRLKFKSCDWDWERVPIPLQICWSPEVKSV